MDNTPNRKNWLERNPKKVVGVIVLLAIGVAAGVTEKLLARKTHNLINPLGIKRSIKLKEFNPLYRDVLVPDADYVKSATAWSASNSQSGWTVRALSCPPRFTTVPT